LVFLFAGASRYPTAAPAARVYPGRDPAMQRGSAGGAKATAH
jgi:hypothetical protein